MTDRSAIERFERIVRELGRRPAVDSPGGALTYAELDERATRTARLLVARGVRPGDRVGLYFERESDAFVGLLATWKAGATAVPLLSSHPPDRLRQIAADGGVRLVLSDSPGPAGGELFGAPVLTAAATADLDAQLPPADANAIATILYTSGTSGRPKGVPQSQALVLHKYLRMQRVLEIAADDHVTFFSTFAMGQGVTALMLTWLSGATLCPFDIRRDGVARLTRWMTDRRVTVWMSSATLLRSLMRTLTSDQEFPHLRVVRISGERVLPADVTASHRHFPAARVFVSYATTETGGISIHAAERGQNYDSGIVPVGSPLDGITVRVHGDDGRDLAPGEEGEIAVESADISTQYWHDEETVAPAFTEVPGHADRRLYHTGDLGRWRPDGQLEHLGRKDLRVKIRGFRIELEEVETVLAQQADVVRAAVAARPGPDGNPRLIGYVQLVPESDITVETLRAQLGLRLPEYMIPGAFVIMDELPLSASGKIARQQLPDPAPVRPALSTEYVGPRNALEAAIAAVWGEILGLERIGMNDAFLSVGGDSLKATLVASRLASRLGGAVPVTMLFEHATIAELSAAIEAARPTE
ncbi:MAG TPA: non-ribosomal peptide synthetase [Vicinamibacterales bacterium]|nr:non-ribosomal peptide synthetase [Vicinamibacterales bacterium]